MKKVLGFIITVLITGLLASDLPVKKCKLSDSECIRTSAQAFVLSFVEGFPNLKIAPLDVMDIDRINVSLSGLHLDIRNIKISGLKNTVIDKISINMEKKELEVIYISNTVVNGKYMSTGKLLSLPFNGDGDMTMTIKQLKVDLVMPFDIIKNDDGKDIISLKNSRFTFDVLENINFQLTNLFDGNKELGDAMIDVINKNWKILSEEFGSAIIEKPTANVYKAIKKYLRSQPLENIALL